jgi:hypothetical protein
MSLDPLGFGSPFDDVVDRFFGGADGESPAATGPAELQQVGS